MEKVRSKFCGSASSAQRSEIVEDVVPGSQIKAMGCSGKCLAEGHVVEVNPVENQKFTASFNLKCTDGTVLDCTTFDSDVVQQAVGLTSDEFVQLIRRVNSDQVTQGDKSKLCEADRRTDKKARFRLKVNFKNDRKFINLTKIEYED